MEQKGHFKIDEYIGKSYTIRLDAGDPWEHQTLDHKIFIERLHFSFNSFPDIKFDIQEIIEDKDVVAIIWILTGTNTGPIGDLPPTNRSICTKGMTIYHFKEDKIVGHSQVFDRNKVYRQLGY